MKVQPAANNGDVRTPDLVVAEQAVMRVADLFSPRCTQALLDPTVSDEICALLCAMEGLIAEAVSERPDLPTAFISQADVAWRSGLDPKTIFHNVSSREGMTLIAKCAEHGLRYTAATANSVGSRRGREHLEAGAYAWDMQFSRTESSPSDSSSIGRAHPEPEAPTHCSGDLHERGSGHDEQDLAALVRPDSVAWSPARMGRAAWRVACVLLLAGGSDAQRVRGSDVASMTGRDASSGTRALARLRREGLVTGSRGRAVFDVRPILEQRRSMLEGSRDPLLGAAERPQRKDVGDPLWNASKSRQRLETRKQDAEQKRAEHFWKALPGLLMFAQSVDLVDLRWLETVQGLRNKDDVTSYIHGEVETGGAFRPKTQVHDTDEMRRRLQAMSDAVRGVA